MWVRTFERTFLGTFLSEDMLIKQYFGVQHFVEEDMLIKQHFRVQHFVEDK